MAKKKEQFTKLVDFPEEIDPVNNIRIYGETSYENQMAVLSHYLHNQGSDVSKERKTEIISAIREFLSRKKLRQGLDEELSDDEVWVCGRECHTIRPFCKFFRCSFPISRKSKVYIHRPVCWYWRISYRVSEFGWQMCLFP